MAEFDHVDFKAFGPRGRREFQTDESGADHDDALTGGDQSRSLSLSSSVRK